VIETMKTTAEETQGPLLDYLSEDERVKEKESYHFINVVYARVTNDLAEELEDEELQEELGIDYVFPDFEIELTQSNEPASQSSRDHVETQSDSIEWNIEQINAPDVWDLGIDGSGVVVGVMDSGVTWRHDALIKSWRGYNPDGLNDPTYSWHDVQGAFDFPYDPYDPHNYDSLGRWRPILGHGTHVTGIILGSDPAENNRIGVAPGAKWIAAKIFEDETGEGDHSGLVATFSNALGGAEWMLEPGGDPDKAPDIINNSWGVSYKVDDDSKYIERLREFEDKWRDAQIFPVTSAGNSGPGGSTEPTDEEGITYPATFEEAFAVGATDSDKNIAVFSSRGPGVDGCVKPDLVAPGVSIRSASTGAIHNYGPYRTYPGSQPYRYAQGTSMASPHVAGVAALLLEADPSLSPGEIEEILIDTAEPLTDSDYPNHPNNAYGQGLVDAYAAVKSLDDISPGLTFTSITPSSITTQTRPYDAELTATGSNFNKVDLIKFTWEGASAGGSSPWEKGSDDWKEKVEVVSDNEMILKPRVVGSTATWSGTDTWTVELRDDTGATISQNFTVTYAHDATDCSISTPEPPTGLDQGYVGEPYYFSHDDYEDYKCDCGSDVEYQYDVEGDGKTIWFNIPGVGGEWDTPGEYDILARLRCMINTEVVSGWSEPKTITIIEPEPDCSVSAPDVPSGVESGDPNENYTYSTGGAECEAGHAVEYRFAWDDGSYSDWSTATEASNSWPSGGTYQVRAQARCTKDPSATSSWSDTLSVTIEEPDPDCSVSAPDVPSGVESGDPNENYTYSTGGAECETGHAVEYRFDWGEGSYSDWSTATEASNSWPSGGTYQVRAQARCAEDTSATSSWSDTLSVTIEEPDPDCSVSAPDVPSGVESGDPNESYTYSTGGAECESGHALEYRFAWGDGSYSDWSTAAEASNSWSSGGTYQVRAQARCAENTAVISSWSDTLSVTIDEPGEADLVAEELTVNPGTSEEGDEITATVVIKNRGGADVTNSFRVDFYEDEAAAPVTGQAGDHYEEIDFLPAGATEEATFSFTPDEAGTYRAWAQVDVFEVIGDSDVEGPEEYVVEEEFDCSVSVPDTPSGYGSGNPDIAYTYTTGGAQCEAGHEVEYRFYWGDGTYSSWSTDAEATYSWDSEGTYQVRAQARCAEDTSVTSSWSDTLSVVIIEEDAEETPVLSAGGDHSLGLKRDGSVWAWGRGTSGQLGDGKDESSSNPVQVMDPEYENLPLSNMTAISAGSTHSLSLKADGTVWAWGRGSSGRLGDGSSISRDLPVQVTGPEGEGYLTGVEAISAGGAHSLALRHDGTVWAWGRGSFGRLGNDDTDNQSSPVQVKVSGVEDYLTGVKAISAGGDHSLALKHDGTVWAWGANDSGKLGDGSTENQQTPVQVRGSGDLGYLSNIVAISAGHNHSLALDEDGSLWAWGGNDSGKLGDGSTEDQLTPVKVKGAGGSGNLSDIEAISAGDTHSVALKHDGSIWAWGDGSYGGLGYGGRIDQETPVQVQGPGDKEYFSDTASISAGQTYTMALKNNGNVWGWGNNEYGQVGDGSTTNTNDPVKGNINLGEVVPPPHLSLLYWQHSNDAIKAWILEENKKDGKEIIEDDVAPDWRVQTAYDMNNSGYSDLVFQHKHSGDLVVWHMNDLEREYDSDILNPATGDNSINPDWEIKAVYDFNNDGNPDIIWQAIDGEHQGELAIWFSLEAGEDGDYEASETGRLTHGDGKATVDANWHLKAVYDLLDDGNPEVLWQAVDGEHEGQLAYWVIDGFSRAGGGRITHVGDSAYIDPSWEMKTVYDLLGNENPEIIWQHEDGRISYWEMNESQRKGGGPLTPASIDDNSWDLVGSHEGY